MTVRHQSPALDEILGDQFDVLDHGFVRVVDYMGNDEAICQAARTSYGKGTKSVNEDRGLIRYLMRHWHSTPFEMCEIKLHVKLPIFVARQWIRHRTANVNEYSARYSILESEFYIPDLDQVAAQSVTNNQGRGDQLPKIDAQFVQETLLEDANNAYQSYEKMIELGAARELARMNLPANIYTQWYWKVDLHNLFHFLRLRADAHAQWEIREYARLILEIVEKWVPHAYEAFVDYRLEAAQFSRMELEAIKDLLADDPNRWAADGKFLEGYGLTRREVAEFQQKLEITK